MDGKSFRVTCQGNIGCNLKCTAFITEYGGFFRKALFDNVIAENCSISTSVFDIGAI